MKAVQHFRTITKHKILVMKECFRVGLYRQGLLHDMSKYGWTEFRVGCKYYQGTRSPNNAERETLGYSSAWLHHKGRNKHHWEFWVDFTHRGCQPAEIPVQYIFEMFCDRVAASMIYQGANYRDQFPLIYYQRGKHSYILHPHSRALLEELLVYLDQNGLEQTLQYIKKRKRDYHL